MSARLSRPALASLLLLAGCGFHPLHGGADADGDVALPEIFVPVIPGRPGQLLRQALQQRLAGSSEATPQDYTLRVAYALDNESIGIHGDNTSSRNRIVGRATWTLSSVAPNPVALAVGNARSVDGFNVVEAQYFAATLADESTNERVAGNLANSIAQQISIWFAAHPNGAVAPVGASPVPQTPAIAPNRGFLGPQNVPGNNDQSPLQQIGPDGLPSGAIGRTTR